MLGMQELNADEMTRKLEDMLPVIRQVNEQFRDPVSEFSMTESIVFTSYMLVMLVSWYFYQEKIFLARKEQLQILSVSIVVKFIAH